MAEQPENAVLMLPRRMDEKRDRIEQRLEKTESDIHELKVTTTSVEQSHGRV